MDYDGIEGLDTKKARAVAAEESHQRFIREKDAEGEANLRENERRTQSAVLSWLGRAFSVLVCGMTVVALVLLVRYVYFIWDDREAIFSLLARAVEWFLVAGAALFVKSRLLTGGDKN